MYENFVRYDEFNKEKEYKKNREEDSLKIVKKIRLLGEEFNSNLKKVLSDFEENDLSEYINKHSLSKIQLAPKFKNCETTDYNCFQKNIERIFKDNFNYPERGLERDIQGEMLLNLFINEKGLVEDVKFKMVTEPLLDPTDDLILEFIRNGLYIISKFPVFYPAIVNGVPTKIPYSLPLKFKNSTY